MSNVLEQYNYHTQLMMQSWFLNFFLIEREREGARTCVTVGHKWKTKKEE